MTAYLCNASEAYGLTRLTMRTSKLHLASASNDTAPNASPD